MSCELVLQTPTQLAEVVEGPFYFSGYHHRYHKYQIQRHSCSTVRYTP